MSARRARIANIAGCTPYESSRSRSMVSAHGAYLVDDDGRRYVDLSNAFGSVLLGHADPVVTARLLDAVRDSVPAAAALRWQEQLAAQLLADTPGAESVAFFKTGTAATRAAVTAARRATGRRLVASAGYHGHDPMWEFGAPLEPGAEDVAHFYYVPHLLDALLAEHADELAAVVIAPDHVHEGNAAAVAELLRRCRRAGVLTIADEVKYGYRMRAGPSTAGDGVTADVYVYAKGIANGWPVSCVAGPSSVLDGLHAAASTLTFETASYVAGAATLERLSALAAQDSIAQEGGRFVAGVRERAAASALPVAVAGTGAAFQLVCPDALEADLVASAFRHGLVLEPHDQQYPSWAFRGAVVDRALEAVDGVLAELAQARPDLLGRPVTTEDVLRCAWLQMDGLPAGAFGGDPAASVAFVRDCLEREGVTTTAG